MGLLIATLNVGRALFISSMFTTHLQYNFVASICYVSLSIFSRVRHSPLFSMGIPFYFFKKEITLYKQKITSFPYFSLN